MNASDRKAATAAYKQQKVVAGIYALRCAASGEIWVDQTRNLGKVQNRVWFMLRAGNHPSPSIQRAFAAHGFDTFTFDKLERMEDEELAYLLDAQLKQRAQHWRTALNALPLL